MLDPHTWVPGWEPLALAALTLAVVVALALVVHRTLFAGLQALARRSHAELDGLVFARLYHPLRWAMVAIAVAIAARGDRRIAEWWSAAAPFVSPALLGWVAYALVRAFAAALEHSAEASPDPLAARSRRTRVAILSRTATFVIVFVTVALMLLKVPGIRDVGVTLMASAGLAALAVGAAAQPALKSLIAGLQMALTEPLRIGDLVVIDGQTGRVEEIRLSFVTVRTWDERALVVPTSRFLDNSFENWSRKSEMLTGPVFLHLDPASDIPPIRDEFLAFIDTQPKWDRRSASLFVTEARADSIELRLAMSSATIGDLFELRAAIREHMLAWLRDNQPHALIHRGVAAESAQASKG